MTVQKLIDELNELKNKFGPDVEVVFNMMDDNSNRVFLAADYASENKSHFQDDDRVN